MEVETKICKICGSKYIEPKNIGSLLKNGPFECPHCTEIINLRKIIEKHSNDFKGKVWSNKIHDRNFISTNYDVKFSKKYKVKTRTLDEHTDEYVIEGRTNFHNDLIDRIEFVRNKLFFEIGPQMEILDSIYINKDSFWEEGINLRYFVNRAVIEYVVIKLYDIIENKKSPYSLPSINNAFYKNRDLIYVKQKIYEVIKFKRSNEEVRECYDPFPILDYLSKLSDVLNKYRKEIKAFYDLRNHEYAHIGKIKDEKNLRNINYTKIRRIYNSLKIIYDGFLFSIAPDKFASVYFDSNIAFSHLNEVCRTYKKYREIKKRQEDAKLEKNCIPIKKE